MGLLITVYLAWAFYSGWKFMAGRIEFLEKQGVINFVFKIICSMAVGVVYGVVDIFLLVFKFLRLMSRM